MPCDLGNTIERDGSSVWFLPRVTGIIERQREPGTGRAYVLFAALKEAGSLLKPKGGAGTT